MITYDDLIYKKILVPFYFAKLLYFFFVPVFVVSNCNFNCNFQVLLSENRAVDHLPAVFLMFRINPLHPVIPLRSRSYVTAASTAAADNQILILTLFFCTKTFESVKLLIKKRNLDFYYIFIMFNCTADTIIINNHFYH